MTVSNSYFLTVHIGAMFLEVQFESLTERVVQVFD